MTIAETAHAGLSHVVNCRRERRNRASAKQAKIGCSLIVGEDDGHTFLKRNGNQTGNDVGSAILLILIVDGIYLKFGFDAVSA